MNAFAANLSFEDKYVDGLIERMKPTMLRHGLELVRINFPGSGFGPYNIGLDLQINAGDFFLFRTRDRRLASNIDLKVERRSSRNIFFETHSNASVQPGEFRPGWGVSLKAQTIWWAFTDTDVMAAINLPELRAWLNEKQGDRNAPRFFSFQERVQTRYAQRNVTAGRLIPFRDMPPAVWKSSYRFQGDEAVQIERDEFLELIGEPATSPRPRVVS